MNENAFNPDLVHPKVNNFIYRVLSFMIHYHEFKRHFALYDVVWQVMTDYYFFDGIALVLVYGYLPRIEAVIYPLSYFESLDDYWEIGLDKTCSKRHIIRFDNHSKKNKIMNKFNESAGATVVAPSDFHDTKSEIFENQQVKRHFLRVRAQARARRLKYTSKL